MRVRVYNIEIWNVYGIIYQGIIPAKSKDQIERDYNFNNCKTVVMYEDFADIDIIPHNYFGLDYILTLKDGREIHFSEYDLQNEIYSDIERAVISNSIKFLEYNLPKQHKEAYQMYDSCN